MPASSIDDAQHWRDRAEEARALAELMRHLDTKQVMLKVAEGYEKLARRAEESAVGSASAK